MQNLLHSSSSSLRSTNCFLSPAPPGFRTRYITNRPFTTTSPARTTPELNFQPPSPRTNPHRAFYQVYGRALFKCLTLAFFTYQVVYYGWLTLETEEIKAFKNREIEGLEGRVKTLQGESYKDGEKRLLEEGGQKT